jgi:gliding motility-associated lipoprotein GldD
MATWRILQVHRWNFRHVAVIRNFRFLAILIGVAGLTSCSEPYTPKPRGFFRIDLPEREYKKFDADFPYTFEYPAYGEISRDSSKLAEPYWINLSFRRFKATLHLSYKPIRNNLEAYLNDAHTMVNKHIPKANAITQREFADTSNRIFGLEYVIRGSDAASPYQFYLTDSTSHFLRGALYFNMVPNNDSLMPVIDFLQADMQHLISSLRWKR